MIIVNQIKCPLNTPVTKIDELICHKLKCKKCDLINWQIIKESIDARGDITFVYSCLVDIKNETKYLKNKDVSKYEAKPYIPLKAKKTASCIVVGFGPCGMFAALTLAKAGLKPIIFERGSKVEKRVKDVETFWHQRKLNQNSNVQFGEGGAGTFSDGKLTTRVKDDRIQEIIETLIENGADEEIRYKQHPHIGTDKLQEIVVNIRNQIIKLGGKFYFDTCVDELIIKNNKCIGVKANNNEYYSDYTILAIGHSAIDTIINLEKQKVYLEPKDFAVGVRVEHPQTLINKNQYKDNYNHPRLKASEYRLTYTTSKNRGVYSFCMCPGGYVVGSSSDENRIVTNGMSESKRDNNYANSAILVQVKKDDFFHGSILDGIAYQKEIEKKAFFLGGENYNAPAQNIKDYIDRSTNNLIFKSTYLPDVKNVDMHQLFDANINEALTEAFINFDHKINGFIEQGIMIGPETRSSSVIRITRNEKLESSNTENLFPSGEGAGYAGGIVSSGLDGIRSAQALINKINN